MPVLATDAGVDTWSPAWYVDPDRLRSVVGHLAASRGPGGSFVAYERVDGHRIGWHPTGLVFAEGHPDDARLCEPSRLAARALTLQEALQAAGVAVRGAERPFLHLGATSEGFAGLRRVDAAVNLEMASRAEGLAFLAGAAAVLRDATGKSEVFYGPDRGVETVYLRGYAGKKVLGRAYDKGLESSTAPRGMVIRVEDQRRYSKLMRRMPEEFTAEAVRGQLRRRFEPLWRSSRGVRVLAPVAVYARLLELVDEGSITPRAAESLAGHIALQSVAGRRGAGIARRTMYRRETQARELGIVVADGVLDEVEVDLGAALEEVMETDRWGVG